MATENTPSNLLMSLSEEMAGAIERAGSSVVTVDGRSRLTASGIVWPGGVVVTADHVLERDEDITVVRPDGQKTAATLAGRDPRSDLAVLRLPDSTLDPADLAPEGSVRIGNFVLALGRGGSGDLAASFGIVSSLGGAWRMPGTAKAGGFIRADLVLYPGFSGGPLVDGQGRVAGLNSSHLAYGRGAAVHSHVVSEIVKMLLAQGRIRRAYLGVASQAVLLPAQLRDKLGLHQASGLIIVNVEPETPADRAGLLMGDILVGVAGEIVASGEDLQTVLGSLEVGKPASVAVVRGGQSKVIEVTPGERA